MSTLKLSSDYEIPVVGLGTWQSEPGVVGTAVIEAIKAGYRHIDCAFIYGNEKEIGVALKTCIGDLKIVKREDLFITSKLWNTKHHQKDVQPALEESLRNLQLEYLDLYLIHWPIAFKRGDNIFPKDDNGELLYDDVSYVETWKALERCVSLGLVRSIGVSNFNSLQVDEIMNASTVKPSVLQVEVHPFLQQEKLLQFCKQRNIVMTAYSSFACPNRPWADPSKQEKVLDNPILLRIAEKHNKSSSQVVLRWLNQRGIVVIPKSITSSRIANNFKVFDFELDEEDMREIATLNKDQRVILPVVLRDGHLAPRDLHAPHFPFVVEF